MSKLEAEDPDYMAAVREYHQQLSKREVLSLDHVLLRVNSTSHLRSAMVKVLDKACSEYTQVLENYNMDKKELDALEGAMDESDQVLPATSCLGYQLAMLQCLYCIYCWLQLKPIVACTTFFGRIFTVSVLVQNALTGWQNHVMCLQMAENATWE